MALFFRILLICIALFASGARANERAEHIAARPNVINFNLLSTVPIPFSWDGRSAASALSTDGTAPYTPDDRTIHISGENSHIKYISWRLDASATNGAAQIMVYKVTNGKTPCNSGTPMMATGKFIDATQAAGTIGTLALGTDTAVLSGTALCIAATGDFSTSAGAITIGIGP
jgi:hypothetical protein